MDKTTVILGLGSNVGDRLGYLRAAARAIEPLLGELRYSRILVSQALLPQGAPQEWNQPFLNMAVAGQTSLAPQPLFERIKGIECQLGRQSRGAWGPREIDIDILAMEDIVLNSDSLTIPHAQLLRRDFALLPLAELAPNWRYPAAGANYGRKATEIAAAQGFMLGEHLYDSGWSLDD